MFTHAIVKTPGTSLAEGISSANLGRPIYEKALEQHAAYIEALKQCGLDVVILEADEGFPDSTFVEDTAILTNKCAIITNPGAETRRGEEKDVRRVLAELYTHIESIHAPATVEGGDVMMVVDRSESYAANAIRVNDYVIIPTGFPETQSAIEQAGYQTIAIDISEFKKLDGGLSCLSLRF